jgi:hypothetical protein
MEVTMEIFENLSGEDLPGEIWKELPKTVMYNNIKSILKLEVSNLGRVRFNGTSIAKQKSYNGVRSLYLQSCGNDPVHRLIAMAWLKDAPKDPANFYVRHISKDVRDNRPENLKWVAKK